MNQLLASKLRSLTAVAENPADYAVDGMTPAMALLPESEGEVAGILAAAAAHGAVVVPWGAGSGQDLGHPPERVDLVLSLARMNRVLAYNPADMTITVEAGMRFADLQAHVGRYGQTLPLDPPRAARSTIGGLVARGASGPRRMAYGAPRDLVLGTRIALPDGTLVRTGGRVVKNVAGYDVNKLIVGSLGTLGVITEVTVRLRPLPAAKCTVLSGFADAGAALAAAEAVLNSALLPAAVVVLSPGAARRLEAPGPVALAIALEETPENVAYQLGRLTHTATLTGPAETAFWQGVSDYGDAFRMRINTTIADVGNYLDPAFDAIAYVGSGTVYRYGDVGADGVLEAAPLAVRRQADVWGPPRPEWKLMRMIKERFDPGRILNRGRFVGGI